MYSDFGKRVSTKRLLYIIALTSIFWFSVNILLMIANNEAARESLEQLSFITHEHKDSNYMHHVNVLPLAPQPVRRNYHFPWLDKEYWLQRDSTKEGVTEKVKFSPGYRELYDISSIVNKNPLKGEMGEASSLDTEEEKKYAESIFANHSFNSYLSDKISLDRTQKDVRGEQ